MTKKYDKDTALAKVKTLISNFYERVGREGREDVEMDAERSELIDDIENVLDNTEISAKHLIVEKLELDKEVKDMFESRRRKKPPFNNSN